MSSQTSHVVHEPLTSEEIDQVRDWLLGGPEKPPWDDRGGMESFMARLLKDRDDWEQRANSWCSSFDSEKQAHNHTRKFSEDAQKETERTQNWYAVRWERLKDLLRDTNLWEQACSIMANGTADPSEPPTYAQQLQSLRNQLDSRKPYDIEEIRSVEYKAISEARDQAERKNAKLRRESRPAKWFDAETGEVIDTGYALLDGYLFGGKILEGYHFECRAEIVGSKLQWKATAAPYTRSYLEKIHLDVDHWERVAEDFASKTDFFEDPSRFNEDIYPEEP